MGKYQKKPVVIDAVQYTGRNYEEVAEFLGWSRLDTYVDEDNLFPIQTPEGSLVARPQDYIIRGVNGEFYPCKPDIFNMTYHAADHISSKTVKVSLRKKGANILERTGEGAWLLDGRPIDQETAIQELVEAVEDLGYWCQVAKDVLPTEEFNEVQRAYEYQD